MAVYEYQHTLTTTASPAEVYALWSDPAGWPAWDASVIAVRLRGPFAVGATGSMDLTDQQTVEFTQRVEIDGAANLAAQFGPAVTADVPESMAALVAHAEGVKA